MMNVVAQPYGKTLGLRYLCLTARPCLNSATAVVLGLPKYFLEAYVVEHMMVLALVLFQ